MLARTRQRRRGLGLWMATALVVGNMIGSGEAAPLTVEELLPPIADKQPVSR